MGAKNEQADITSPSVHHIAHVQKQFRDFNPEEYFDQALSSICPSRTCHHHSVPERLCINPVTVMSNCAPRLVLHVA